MRHRSNCPQGETISRRSLVLGGALAALSASCSRSEARQEPRLNKNGDGQGGGELRVAFDGAGVSTIALDPQNSGYAPHNRVMRSMFDSLTRLNPDQSVSPWLAESWTVSPDRTTYEFKLRPGVQFHDGTPLDAAALKANFDRVAEPKNALNSRVNLGPYAGCEVIDPDRVRLRLTEPFTPLLRNLSMTKLAIISPAAVAKYGQTFNQQPVATGPFRFVALEPGRAVHLERNPDYKWAHGAAGHNGPAHLERLTFVNVPEEATRIAALRAGEVQAADLIPAQYVSEFRLDPAYALLEKELLNTNYSLSINVAREPWNDDEIRLAVRLAIDIEQVVRSIYFGTFPRAWSYLNTTMFGSAEKLLADSWRPDPARSRQILERKGWNVGADGVREKDGKKLTLHFLDSQGNREKRLDLMELVKNQLRQVGIQLIIDSRPGSVVLGAMRDGNFDAMAGASFHADPDILRQLYDPTVRSAYGWLRVADPELIEWLGAGAREPDGPARADYYYKTQRKILDKTYAIPFYILLYNLAVSKGVAGVSIDNHGFPEFYDARRLG
ncbi:MAG: ABC transporter substrate-binding protein [Polyangiaceae bacterium]